jgi:hypothetical protein
MQSVIEAEWLVRADGAGHPVGGRIRERPPLHGSDREQPVPARSEGQAGAMAVTGPRGVKSELGRRQIERGAPVADLGVSIGCRPQERHEKQNVNNGRGCSRHGRERCYLALAAGGATGRSLLNIKYSSIHFPFVSRKIQRNLPRSRAGFVAPGGAMTRL